MRQFIVTGCGRSGTQYMATLLARVGCNCGEEKLFNLRNLALDGEFQTFCARDKFLFSYTPVFGIWGESSWLAAPYLAWLPSATVILHQTRSPLDVVRSKLRIKFFQRNKKVGTLAFAMQHCPMIEMGTAYEQAVRYWIYWNRLVEQAESNTNLLYLRYRIEDMDFDLLQKIFSLLQFSTTNAALRDALDSHPRNFNTKGDKQQDEQINWDGLSNGTLRIELQAAADKYGYSLDL